MYHPTGFSDSQNIIIKNNVPCYYYTGSSYFEKLKNGLSLEETYIDLTFINQNNSFIIENKREESKPKIIKNIYYEKYDNIDINLKKKISKNKPIKKQKKYEGKKYKNRQIGYKIKLLNNNDNLVQPCLDNEIDKEEKLIDKINNTNEDFINFINEVDDYTTISDYDDNYFYDEDNNEYDSYEQYLFYTQYLA